MQPTPAIVAQGAVRRLPRLALWLLCWAYVLPGFLGRQPWKNADLAAFGYMAELARADSWADWLRPQLLGLPPEIDGPLPYWLGALMLKLAPAGLAPDLVTRLPFIGLLMLTLAATWYAVYHLARSPGAQPVAFAFGGEAHPTDYARALADGGLLALMGCLGLAQLAHETTPAMLQLCCAALTFYAATALPSGRHWTWLAGGFGLLGLALSGAPSMALLLGAGVTVLLALDRSHPETQVPLPLILGWALLTVLAAGVASGLDLWRWRITGLPQGGQWLRWGKLLLWFTWPVWPLALWTLWRWRRQLGMAHRHRHLLLPLWFALVALVPTLVTPLADRSLLLGLPALATLAAFALPTFSRSARALIDWFTLVFFSGCAVVIWVIWLAMETGIPAAPARNVAKLAPGFVPSFQLLPTVLAVLATLGWIGLVWWRTARHRKALWKSMVLPASGAILCWLLLTTLWLPLLDYARSYAPVMQTLTRTLGHPDCVQVQGLTRDQITALRFYGDYRLEPWHSASPARCPWLVVTLDKNSPRPSRPDTLVGYDPLVWTPHTLIKRPTDQYEAFWLLRRRP